MPCKKSWKPLSLNSSAGWGVFINMACRVRTWRLDMGLLNFTAALMSQAQRPYCLQSFNPIHLPQWGTLSGILVSMKRNLTNFASLGFSCFISQSKDLHVMFVGVGVNVRVNDCQSVQGVPLAQCHVRSALALTTLQMVSEYSGWMDYFNVHGCQNACLFREFKTSSIHVLPLIHGQFMVTGGSIR